MLYLKKLTLQSIAAFTGHHPLVGIGHKESGLTLSPVQLLFDREITKGFKFLEHPLIDEDSIGLEAILDVGFGKKKNYLDREHFLKNFRDSLWLPEFFDRTGWTPETEKNILDKAKKKVRQLIGEYKNPEVDPEMIAEVKKIVERAKKDLL